MAMFMEMLIINFIPAGGKPLSAMLNLHVFSKDTNNNKKELHFRYKSKIGSKLSKLCTRIMKLLCLHLMPVATTNELRVIYLKMEWDY
ncbi:14-3-3-like protein GF14 kappa [Diospyros lotus]|uniref:14-3-3-like protein GF14 kappa n=1 Tax=Diospyros lotus TaxID=55363 RepID=UPI0022527D3E|nr:14-3-3-like protein GF14 kappa [Diospyros lotus]